jgi:hypothetical protein
MDKYGETIAKAAKEVMGIRTVRIHTVRTYIHTVHTYIVRTYIHTYIHTHIDKHVTTYMYV